MGYSPHRCVAHGEAELAALWYYRATAHGLEYLCADGYAQRPDSERLAWRLLPDSAM